MTSTEYAGHVSGHAPCVPGGHRHWGPNGAAGILPYATKRGRLYVLLTLRSPHVAQGGTWSVPGGAIELGETAQDAAIAEAAEELAGLPELAIKSAYEAPCPHDCGWSYVTFLASAGRYFRNLPDVEVTEGLDRWETDDVAWIPAEAVQYLDLHPAFRAAWPELAARLFHGRKWTA